MNCNRNLCDSPEGDVTPTHALARLPDQLLPHEGDQIAADPFARVPAELLPLIASCLPLPEAVRTSVLSTKWRYAYRCVNSFDFDGYLLWRNYRGNRDDLKDLFHVITLLLLQNPNPTVPFIRNSRFGVIPSAVYTDSAVESFILAAVGKKVEHLDIRWISNGPAIWTLPCSLFTCTSLVKLVLFDAHFAIGKLDRIDLPNLRTLSLDGCAFTCPDTVKLFFSGGLLLEELVLKSCVFTERDIFISIPSLKVLFICSSYKVRTPCNLVNCTSLVTLKLFAVELPFEHLDRFPNLKTLRLREFQISKEAMMFFSECLLLEELVLKQCTYRHKLIILVMPSLKKLKIKYASFEYSSGHEFVLRLKTPALEYLKIHNMVCDVYMKVDLNHLIQVDHHITNDSTLYSSVNDGYSMEKFVVGVRKVGVLTLSAWSQKIFTRYGFQPPIFGKLIHLNLGKGGEFTWKILIRMPKCAPNLDILDFYEGLPPYSVPPLFCKDLNVKLICIRDFTGWDGEVASLKHLVDNAKLLKMIVIQDSSSLHVELMRKICHDLTEKKRRFKLGRKKIKQNDEELIFWVVRLGCEKGEPMEEEEEPPEEEEEDVEFFQGPYSSLYYPLTY